MAESRSPVEAAAPSQKRPLEEPSSPSGPTDGPNAKRPALDKVNKDTDSDATLDNVEASVKTEPELETATEQAAPPAAETVASPVSTNGNIVISAAANSSTSRPDTQALHSQGLDEGSWLHQRAIITSAEAATIIGKGGENVQQIRRMSGAKCTVSEYTRGAVERILTVSGTTDSVAKAFGLIIRTLNQENLETPSTPQSKTYPLRLLIPHILIGSIIGKGGLRIKEIQEASGARLNASEACLPLSTERSLVVLGVADAIHIATYYVGRTLVEQLTERFGGPGASNYGGRHGHAQGAMPGGMQVSPYSPMPAGGQIGHPSSENYRRGPPGHGAAPPAAPYMPQYMAPPPQYQQGPMPHAAGSPRGPYMGAGPQAPQHSYQPQQAMHPVAAQPMAAGAGFAGQPITQQIYIPNDMVGAIIGKGGAKINEIRTLSGSVIKINEPQDNSNERLVTVTGTAECNQMALYMLYSRLGESNKNSNSTMPR